MLMLPCVSCDLCVGCVPKVYAILLTHEPTQSERGPPRRAVYL